MLLLDDVHKRLEDPNAVVQPRVTSYGSHITRDVLDASPFPGEEIIVERKKKKKKKKSKKTKSKKGDMNETNIDESDLHVRSRYGEVVDPGMYVPSILAGTDRENVFNDYLEGNVAFNECFRGPEERAWQSFASEKRKLLSTDDVAMLTELRLQGKPPEGERMKYVSKLYTGDNVVLRSGMEVPRVLNSSTDTEASHRESLPDVSSEIHLRDVSSVSLSDQVSAVEGMKRMDTYSEGASGVHDRAYDDVKLNRVQESPSFLKSVVGTISKLTAREKPIEMEDVGDPGGEPIPLDRLVVPVAAPKEVLVNDVSARKLPPIHLYSGESISESLKKKVSPKKGDSGLILDRSEKNPTVLFQSHVLRESRKLEAAEQNYIVEGVKSVADSVSAFAKRKLYSPAGGDEVDLSLLMSPEVGADRRRATTIEAEMERKKQLERMAELERRGTSSNVRKRKNKPKKGSSSAKVEIELNPPKRTVPVAGSPIRLADEIVVGKKTPEVQTTSFSTVMKNVGKVALATGAVGAGVMMIPAVLPELLACLPLLACPPLELR